MTNSARQPQATHADGGVRSLSRALAILDAFRAETTMTSVASLARRTGLARTTTIRLVETLIEEKMLMAGSDGKLRTGPRLVQWQRLAAVEWSVPESTTAQLRHLSDVTGETISITAGRDGKSFVIAEAESRSALRHVVRVGDELTSPEDAAVVILLGVKPPKKAVANSAEAGPVDRSDTPSGPRFDAGAATRDGYAVSHGTREPGVSVIAVPVAAVGASPTWAPVALTLSGPTERVQIANINDILTQLHIVAAAIAPAGLPPALY